MLLDKIPESAEGEHNIDERRYQRQQDLENHDVRQSDKAQRPFARENSTVFVDGLQNSKRPAKPLAHQAIRIGWRLRVSQRHVFIFHTVAAAQQSHCQISILGHCIDLIAAGLAHG